MDSNALYKDMIELAEDMVEPLPHQRHIRQEALADVLDEETEKAADPASFVLAMDEWLRRDSFLPDPWNK